MSFLTWIILHPLSRPLIRSIFVAGVVRVVDDKDGKEDDEDHLQDDERRDVGRPLPVVHHLGTPLVFNCWVPQIKEKIIGTNTVAKITSWLVSHNIALSSLK